MPTTDGGAVATLSREQRKPERVGHQMAGPRQEHVLRRLANSTDPGSIGIREHASGPSQKLKSANGILSQRGKRRTGRAHGDESKKRHHQYARAETWAQRESCQLSQFKETMQALQQQLPCILLQTLSLRNHFANGNTHNSGKTPKCRSNQLSSVPTRHTTPLQCSSQINQYRSSSPSINKSSNGAKKHTYKKTQ